MTSFPLCAHCADTGSLDIDPSTHERLYCDCDVGREEQAKHDAQVADWARIYLYEYAVDAQGVLECAPKALDVPASGAEFIREFQAELDTVKEQWWLEQDALYRQRPSLPPHLVKGDNR